MKTKTSILAALVALAGSTSLMAQVYSLNVVGYANVVITNGFTIIANPLVGQTNTVAALFPSVPDQTAIYRFSGGAFSGNAFEFGSWGDPSQVILPGEGVFIYNPGSTYTNTFVGEVMTGNLANPIPAGFSLRSSQVPQAGLLQTALGYVPNEGDAIYQFKQGQGYNGASYEFGAWSQEPNVAVGEGFFVFNNSSAKSWNRTFNPNTP